MAIAIGSCFAIYSHPPLSLRSTPNHDSAYQYGGSANCPAANKAGPNALCRLEKLNSTIVQFSYDGRGNLINGDGLTLTYNALDKPLTIIGRGPGNNTNTAFTYGSDGMRAKQTRTVSGNTTTTYYVDKLFEMDNDGSWRAYIDDIAVLSWTPEQQHKLLYTLRDRLGSATTLVNQDGQVTSRRYFDPFGRTSSASGSEHLSNTQFSDLLATNRYRRGFTDHEHLNEQQLIHMNGRKGNKKRELAVFCSLEVSARMHEGRTPWTVKSLQLPLH